MRHRQTGVRAWVAALAVAVVGTNGPGASNPPKPPATDEIVLGMSTVLTGPSARLGLGVKLGVDSAVAEANRAGGIKGRKVRLIALDDGYEPSRTGPNMRRLVEEEGVVAVIGNVGTPTAVVSIPIAMDSGTPLVGCFTGAGVLRRTPPDRYVFNYRASYAQETGSMVDALVEHAGVKPEEVAFFTQRDAYGDAGYAGGMAALRRHGLKAGARVAHGRYERNTLGVENAVADVLSAELPARAVIMVGSYAPTAEFVKQMKSAGSEAAFLSVSFVGTMELCRELGPLGDGVIVTQVVPPPESDAPAAKAHRAALASMDPEAEASFLSLEGYAAARMLLMAIERIEGRVDRESITASLETMGSFDLGLGEPLRLTKEEHQACQRVWPTVLRGGRAEVMCWTALASRRAGVEAGR